MCNMGFNVFPKDFLRTEGYWPQSQQIDGVAYKPTLLTKITQEVIVFCANLEISINLKPKQVWLNTLHEVTCKVISIIAYYSSPKRCMSSNNTLWAYLAVMWEVMVIQCGAADLHLLQEASQVSFAVQIN